MEQLIRRIDKLPTDVVRNIARAHARQFSWIHDSVQSRTGVIVNHTITFGHMRSITISAQIHRWRDMLYASFFAVGNTFADSWKGDSYDVFCVPLARHSSHRADTRKTVAAFKRLWGEYHAMTYAVGRRNFGGLGVHHYSISLPNWEASAAGREGIAWDRRSYSRVRGKDLVRALTDTWGGSYERSECWMSCDVLSYRYSWESHAWDVFASMDAFAMSDHFWTMGSFDMREPYDYYDMQALRRMMPIAYDHLERFGSLKSKRRVLGEDARVLISLKRRLDDAIDTLQMMYPHDIDRVRAVLKGEFALEGVEEPSAFNEAAMRLLERLGLSTVPAWLPSRIYTYVAIPNVRAIVLAQYSRYGEEK